METGYLGGALRRGLRGPHAGRKGRAGTLALDWRSATPEGELFLTAWGRAPDGVGPRVFAWESLALLVSGYVRSGPAGEPLDVERVAEELRCHYLEHGDLPVRGLEGNFSLALLDGLNRRVLLYRNLVGSTFTYYHAGPDGLRFGSNLAELVESCEAAPRPNRDALPALFLFRCVPGRETLFDGFFRLLPGELLAWDEEGGLSRSQRLTFADLRRPAVRDGDALDALDETMGRVLRDCARHRPGTANLLSGGVDSSFLQALWNRAAAGPGDPVSYSITVDHRRTRGDTEYAVTAARALGTRHTLVPADEPYAGYLVDALAATGEMPNHVQSAYYGHLARVMVQHGHPSGLCGEGADSLFGVGLANKLHNGACLRRLLPVGPLRRAGAALAGWLGWPGLRAAFDLSCRADDLANLAHPVNQVAAWADWGAAEACFGRAAVAEAAARRRSLLDLLRVPRNPLDRLHGSGLLGEAVNTAALWTTLFHQAGGDLLCPFLDSRMLGFAMGLSPRVRFRFRRPKDLLKRALARLAPAELAYRPKLGFGQPIFEWLAPGGSLGPLVRGLGDHDFVDGEALRRARERPSWFLYTLLCYDVWHKLFIDRSLPRPGRRVPHGPAPAEAVGTGS